MGLSYEQWVLQAMQRVIAALVIAGHLLLIVGVCDALLDSGQLFHMVGSMMWIMTKLWQDVLANVRWLFDNLIGDWGEWLKVDS